MKIHVNKPYIFFSKSNVNEAAKFTKYIINHYHSGILSQWKLKKNSKQARENLFVVYITEQNARALLSCRCTVQEVQIYDIFLTRATRIKYLMLLQQYKASTEVLANIGRLHLFQLLSHPSFFLFCVVQKLKISFGCF